MCTGHTANPLCEQPLFVDTGSMVMVTGISSQGFKKNNTRLDQHTNNSSTLTVLFMAVTAEEMANK